MQKIKLLFAGLAMMVLAPSKAQQIDYVIYGVYCGECISHCAIMFKVDEHSGNVWVDTTNSFFRVGLGHIKFGRYKANYSFYLKSKAVIDSMPPMLLDTTNHTEEYGMPDARDQCGIYVEYKIGKYSKSFTIDTAPENGQDIPLELQPYREIIENLSDEFFREYMHPVK